MDLSAGTVSIGNTPLDDFSAGTDSPVREDSSDFISTEVINLTSAGMISPSSKTTKSPGTTSSALMEAILPPRFTVQVGVESFFKASSDCSAFCSWIEPISALTITIANMTIQSIHSSAASPLVLLTIKIAKEIKAAIKRTMTIGSVNCLRNLMIKGEFLASWSLLGPYSSNLFLASSGVKPLSGSV